MYAVDILNRRASSFVLWLPGITPPNPPQLVLGTYDQSGTFKEVVHKALKPADKPHLWHLDPTDLDSKLPEGVYRYWFQVGGSLVTDPMAYTVDYGHVKDRSEDVQPPGVIKYRDGKLWPCDVDGTEPGRPRVPPVEKLPANNHLVIYELPTSWAKGGNDDRGVDVDVGTFADVKALFDVDTQGKRFASISAVRNEAILAELGINALELLPAADGKSRGAWGYATANYFAPDYDLGTASELVSLVDTINDQNIRLFTDVVMAFGHDPYGAADFSQFHINPNDEPNNPDSYQSHAVGQKRDGYGGMLWRYIQDTVTYDPEAGEETMVHPSWAFHKSHLTRWVSSCQLSTVCLMRLSVRSWLPGRSGVSC